MLILQLPISDTATGGVLFLVFFGGAKHPKNTKNKMTSEPMLCFFYFIELTSPSPK